MNPARSVAAALKAQLLAWDLNVVDERARVTDATLPTPFVVLDGPEITRGTDRQQRHSMLGAGIVQTTVMGVSTEQAMWLQEKVETALLDVTLAVSGHVMDPLVMDSPARWLEPFTSLPDRTLYQCATRWRVRAQAS